MRYGCYADEYGYSAQNHLITPYKGPDLSQRTCPYGYDVRFPVNSSTVPLREVQRIRCRASSGSFTLSFRGFISDSISYSTSLSSFKTILESMGAIGVVMINETTGSTTVCASGSITNVEITFMTELGSVPTLVVSTNSLSGGSYSFAITTKTQSRYPGATYKECAGRGLCDYETGECECWPQRGSSNGLGIQGQRGDCGSNIVN
jgi:hypothetical protein